MTDIFLVENGNFSNYSAEHYIAFFSCLIFIGIILYKGKHHWSDIQKRKYITIICTLGALTQLFKVIYKYHAGIFDQNNDVPLHLCNQMTLIMPFILWFQWREAWSITFFWIMAGCAQSIITPTLTESMPHYEAVRYWAVHAVIILGALYGWYGYGWRIHWRDCIRSIIGLNILAAIIYPVNVWLGSNYMYLNGKPPGKTIYDLLGSWPDYILTLEFVVIIFFSLLLIPFYWTPLKYYFKNIISQKA